MTPALSRYDEVAPPRARRQVREGDIDLVLALVAHQAAARCDYDLGDLDASTCVADARRFYRTAISRYLRAARACSWRPRSDVRNQSSATAWRRTPADAATLDHLQTAALGMRASLRVERPALLKGRIDPVFCVDRLRAGVLPAISSY
jgi:hypothetical protein